MFLFGLSPLVYAAAVGGIVREALRSGEVQWPRMLRGPVVFSRYRQPVRYWWIVAANALVALFFALTPLIYQLAVGF